VIDSDAYKATMRRLAAGVIVITTELDGRPHAMTATAFTPLSLEPPMVLVCIHRQNDTHRALCAAERFGINLLSESQSDLASRFAGKSPARYNFGDVRRFTSPRGVMLLSDCAAVIEAERVQKVDAGDHSIFIAHVTWARTESSADPLVYFSGEYQRLQPLPPQVVLGSTGT